MRKILITSLIMPFLILSCVTKGKFKIMEKSVQVEEVKEVGEVEEVEEDKEKKESKETEETTEKKEEKEIKKEVKKVEEVKKAKEEARKIRKIENKAFNIGEKFTFAIECLGITGGIATIEVKELVKVDGHLTYHLITTTKSLPVVSMFYRVNDVVESYIDFDGIFSRKLIKSLREGNHLSDVTLFFDQGKNIVKQVEKNKELVYNIPEYCQDILSCFYYFRAQKIEVGKDIFIDVHADGQNHKLQVKVIKKEKIKTPLGKYEAFVIKPFMQFESIFKQEGDVTLWVSADEKHLPLLMKSKVFVGSVNAKLIDAVVVK
ncbi:MAG: DUF3108 domain-containing protein [Candidatus Firestonebacteria bacterium]